VRHYTVERSCEDVTEKTLILRNFVPVRKSVNELQRENIEIIKVLKNILINIKQCTNEKTVNESQKYIICDKLESKLSIYMHTLVKCQQYL